MRVIGVRSIRAPQPIYLRRLFRHRQRVLALIIRAARVVVRQVIKRTRKTKRPDRGTAPPPLFILLINLLIRNAKYRAIHHQQAEFFIYRAPPNNTKWVTQRH